MSDEHDPTRLADGEAPDFVRVAIDEARAEKPSPERLERVAAGLAPLLVPPSVAAGGGAAGAAGGGTLSPAIKIGAAIVGAGLIGGAAVWLSRAPEPTPPAQTSPASPASLEAPADRAPEPAAEPEPAEPDEEEAAAEPPPEPAASPARPKGDPAKKRGPTEAQLLGQAQAALKSDPNRALALVAEHRRRFPSGALAQEREVIAIDALKRAGKAKEAEKRRDSFKKTYPGSPHGKKVRSP